jgi:prepilin-type N-terminal cleavage/methylation domain-containing protein
MCLARKTARKHAFTLLEMAIVVGIITIISGSIIVFARDMISKRQAIDTESKMNEIVEALEHYYQLNGHFPCPASLTAAKTATTIGQMVNSGDCTYTSAPTGTLRVETAASSGVWVLMGALPTHALSMTNEMMQDGYGNRFSYIVMQTLTEASTFAAGAGALTIKDGPTNNIITDGAFVVFSHGSDGTGSYLHDKGTLKTACGAANLDTENCDWDVTFVDAPYNNGSVAANYFDDFIRWKSKQDYQ